MKAASLERLLDAALLQQFPTRVTLIHEGGPADFLHVLVDGLVEIYTEQAGAEWGISLINPVSTFILAAVVSDQPYLNSARTLAESRVLLIPARRVREVFDRTLRSPASWRGSLRWPIDRRSRSSRAIWPDQASSALPTGF